MVSALAIAAIRGYQRHLSPRKGFACAYRLRHGGTGCSGFAKGAIADHGLRRALPMIRQRLRDCRGAALAFAAEGDPRARKRRGSWDCSGLDGCGWCGQMRGAKTLAETGGPEAPDAPTCDMTHCTGCDIHAAPGCDCSCDGCSW